MDVFYFYTYSTAGWLALQAAPLLASPTIITTMLSPEVRESTALEEYFSRLVGINLLALAALSILLTGTIPLQSTLADTTNGTAGTTTDPTDPKAPYAMPSLIITMIYHVVVGFFCYARFISIGSFPFIINAGVHALFAAVGLWCVLFASTNGRISRRTGADKRTSNFPFKNKEAHQRKMK